MPRFTANCSLLFTEVPFLRRFGLAKSSGFDVVECWWPSGVDLEAFARAVREAEVRLVLMGLDPGDVPAGEFGYLNEPAQHAAQRATDNLRAALRCAEQLGEPSDMPLLNVFIGNQRDDEPRKTQLARACERLKSLAEIAGGAGSRLVLEPLNSADNPDYLIQSHLEALEVIDAVGATNLGLLFDAYHIHRSGADPAEALRESIRYVYHAQIADVPGRHEPGTGEMDCEGLLQTLDDLNYEGYVGLEYFPLHSTDSSLEWLPNRHK